MLNRIPHLFHGWDEGRASDVLFGYLVESDQDIARARKVIENSSSHDATIEDYIAARFIQFLEKNGRR